MGSLAWVSSRLSAPALSSKSAAFSALALSVTAAAMSSGSYGSSKYIYALLEGVGLSLYAAPAQSVLVAILGLCFFPGARATHSTWVSWSSPRSSGKSGPAAESVHRAPSAALASKQRALEALGMTRCHSSGGSTTQLAPTGFLSGLQRFASIPAVLLQRSDSASSTDGSQSASSSDRSRLGGSRLGDSSRMIRRSSSDSARHNAGVLSARPTADLDVMADGRRVSTAGSSSGSTSPRRRVFNLGIPRVHVELSPLPRLLFDFGGRRAQQQQLQQQQRRRWQQDSEVQCSARREMPWLTAEGPSPRDPIQQAESSPSSAQGSAEVQWSDCTEQLPSPKMRSAAAVAAGNAFAAMAEAPASLGLDTATKEVPELAEALTDTHLLQFGAMLGERSSRAALAAREAGGPIGHPDSFYGSPDTDAFCAPWEPLVQEATAGVRYWAWRRPLRKGLHLYMTRTVFLDATPADVRRFTLDDAYRVQWDDAMLKLDPIPAGSSSGNSGGSSSGSGGLESTFMHSVVRFPKPMAPRSYTYARRVWPRPSDGGCFCLSKAAEHPAALAAAGRAVNVEDYASAFVLRAPAAHLVDEGAGPSCEQLLVYFEDSHVRAGLANLGIRKGLWPLVQRTERALRAHQAAATLRVPANMGAAAATAAEAQADSAAAGQEQLKHSQSMAKPAPIDVGHGTQSSSRTSSSGSSWSMLGMLKRSGAVLLEAGTWLWRAQAALSTLLPRLELRMLRWAFDRALSPRTAPRLLGSSFSWMSKSGSQQASGSGASAHPAVRSRRSLCGPGVPCTPRAGAGGIARVLCAQSSQDLRRLGSHPVMLEDHQLDEDEEWQGDAAAAAAGGEPFLGSDWPVAAYTAGAWAANSSWDARSGGASSNVPSYPPSSYDSGSDEEAASGSEGYGRGGSRRGGGRRGRPGAKQRFMVRLIQAAGLRLAHKLLVAADARRASEV